MTPHPVLCATAVSAVRALVPAGMPRTADTAVAHRNRAVQFLIALLIVLTGSLPADDAVPKAEIVQPMPSPAAGPEAIQRAVQSMKAAQAQLAEGQTGTATQDLQKQVLAALDELLKTPPKPPQPNPSGNSGGGQQQNSSSSQSNSQKPDDAKSSAGQQQGSGSQQQTGQLRDRSQADDSEERTGNRRVGVAATLPRRRLEVDVWGHLPEKVREQLLNGYGERMVPQYEALVRKFYESLADTAAESDRTSVLRRP
ncbi:MAG: hypothetical protein SH850_01985 [Planctomycetaceae bacterium]|nr:hypothetical protein [Planctomycetaceae bacterium]